MCACVPVCVCVCCLSSPSQSAATLSNFRALFLRPSFPSCVSLPQACRLLRENKTGGPISGNGNRQVLSGALRIPLSRCMSVLFCRTCATVCSKTIVWFLGFWVCDGVLSPPASKPGSGSPTSNRRSIGYRSRRPFCANS